MANITKIESCTVISAEPAHVWAALLDSRRWANWLPDGSPARIEIIESVDRTFERVGDRRRCSAVVSGLPLLRERRLTWDEQVTDLDRERTLEVEALPAFHAIRRWRIRFWLVPEPGAGTRVRCHVSYRPASVTGWLADRLFLRGRVTTAAEAWLNNLAASFEPAEVREASHAPDVGEALVAA
ncbi:MAG: SRPBCC family protein [Chloroflexota bacterium]